MPPTDITDRTLHVASLLHVSLDSNLFVKKFQQYVFPPLFDFILVLLA